MILSNQVRCLKCNDTPFSGHRHDFSSCECGSISVDGGTAYLRRVGDIGAYESMSIEIPDEAGQAAIENIKWAQDTGRNEFGILCAVARGLRDGGVRMMSAEELAEPIMPNSDAEWDLEAACFQVANDSSVPEHARKLVTRLWAAFVDREKLISGQEGATNG